MDQLLEKLKEAHKQLNQTKAKETETIDRLQNQTQKLQAPLMFLCIQPHSQNKLLQRTKGRGVATDIKLDEIFEVAAAPPLLLHLHLLQPHLHQATNQNSLTT